MKPPPGDRHAWAQLVVAALAALPDQQTRIVELLYFDLLTERQASDRLGIALSQVRADAAEALRRLGASLEHRPSQ